VNLHLRPQGHRDRPDFITASIKVELCLLQVQECLILSHEHFDWLPGRKPTPSAAINHACDKSDVLAVRRLLGLQANIVATWFAPTAAVISRLSRNNPGVRFEQASGTEKCEADSCSERTPLSPGQTPPIVIVFSWVPSVDHDNQRL
jgi:hypothetical protein